MSKEHDDRVDHAHGVPAKIDAIIANGHVVIDSMEKDLNAGVPVAEVCKKAHGVLDELAANKHKIK